MHRVREAVDHTSERIQFFCSITCIDVTEPSLLESLLDGQVKHRLLLTVVNTCDAAEIRLSVVGLHLIHNLCGQVLHRHVLVIAKELLTSHEDSSHRLTIHLDGTILNGHTRQLLDEVFQHTSFGHLEGISIEDEGVVLHLHLLQFTRHHSLTQLDAALGHHDGANGLVAFVVRLPVHSDGAIKVVVTYIRYFHDVVAVLHALHRESTVFCGGVTCHQTCRVCTHDSHGAGNQCLTGFTVNYLTRQGGLRKRCDSHHRKDKRENSSLENNHRVSQFLVCLNLF